MKKKDFALGILCGAILFSGATAMAAGITAEPTWQSIYVDGEQVSMTAYNIAGNNYVKLRDIGQKVGFNVYWLDGVQIDIDVAPVQEAEALCRRFFPIQRFCLFFWRQDRKSLQWHQGHSCRRSVQRVERPVAGSESVRVTTMS